MATPLDRYEVVKTDSKMFPYELHGPRGARYGLTRNVPDPTLLFALNMRTKAVMDRLGWFTDRDGELKWVGR